MKNKKRNDKPKPAKIKEVFLEDRPHLLHRNPGMGRSDYTDIPAFAMREEPESVDPGTLVDFARDNRSRFERWRQGERNNLSLADRVAELERREAAGDAAARRQLFVIRQRVRAAERREGRKAS